MVKSALSNLLVPSPLNSTILFTTLSAILFLGLSVFVGWLLAKVMKTKGYVSNMAVVISLMTGFAILLFIRYGIEITSLQGIFLSSLLIYASCSDLTRHEVDDYVWVTVLALSLCSLATEGIFSMLIGAF